MKKKMKDFTIDELADLCGQTSCDKCPFRDYEVLCDFINAFGKDTLVEAEADTEGNLTQLEGIV